MKTSSIEHEDALIFWASQLSMAAAAGDIKTIDSMLVDRTPSVDLSNACILAILQATTSGHIEAVRRLLPLSHEQDPNAAALYEPRYDASCFIAISKGTLDIVKLLFPLVSNVELKTSSFIQFATNFGQREVTRWLLPKANLAMVYATLVKDETWSGLDFLATELDEGTRRAWFEKHTKHMPQTAAMLLAGQRAEKGATLGVPDGTPHRQRWRA